MPESEAPSDPLENEGVFSFAFYSYSSRWGFGVGAIGGEEEVGSVSTSKSVRERLQHEHTSPNHINERDVLQNTLTNPLAPILL